MNTKWLLFFLFLVLVGCKGGQNPLHEYPDYIQNATLPENIPQKPIREPVSSEFARIITNDPWAIVVGQEFAMEIDAYLFLEDDMYQDFRVELTPPPPEGEDYSLEEIVAEDRDYDYEEGDEEENNGHVLKQKEYLFKWTPSQSILEEDIRKVYYLTFTLITDGEVALIRNKTIPVFISRRFEIPEIKKVKLPKTLKEGETGEMTVLVEVPDSSEMQSPTLQFESPDLKTHSDLRGYLSFVEKKWLENGKWEFKYFIDLPKGIDVSVSQKKHSLRVRVISPFGIQSEFTKAEMTVNNTVQDPVVVGPSDAMILEGGRTNVFLSAYDSALSGEQLSARLVTPLISLPGEVFLSYLPISGGGLEISINWFLPEGIENLKDSYRVEIEVENKGREGVKVVRKKKRHFVNIHVEKLPVPVEEEVTSEETPEEVDGNNVSEVSTETSANPEKVNVEEVSQVSNVPSEGNEVSVEKGNETSISTEPSETTVETTEDDPKVATNPDTNVPEDTTSKVVTTEETDEGSGDLGATTPVEEKSSDKDSTVTDEVPDKKTKDDENVDVTTEAGTTESETSEDAEDVSSSSDESQKEDNDKPSESTAPEGSESESSNEDLTTPPLSAVHVIPFYNLKGRGLS